MSIRLIWVTIYLSQGFIIAQFICMNKEVNGNNITVNCTVNTFLTNIDFKLPNNIGSAFCSVPGPEHSDPHGDCRCDLTIPGHCTITQDIATKTTTIQIRNTNFTDIFGWYKCKHGSFEESIMVKRHCECRLDDADEIVCETKYLYGSIVMMTIGLGSAIWSCVYCKIPSRLQRKVKCYFSTKQNQKDSKEKPQFCDICKTSFVCEICIDCKEKFCDACCVHHIRSNPGHRVCHVHHIAQCHLKIYCDNCRINIASRLCLQNKCLTPFCISCGACFRHGENAMRKIYQGTLDSIKQSPQAITHDLVKNDDDTIPIKRNTDDEYPVRICGLGYLENGKLAMADSNNRKLIVIDPKNKLIVLEKKLGKEPRAMTAMNGNEIAITFPYKEEIQVYIINSNGNKKSMEINEGKTICLSKIGLPRLKPFSISFDKDVFAVEVGEGEDGRIVIIDNKDNSVRHRITPNAFFTGHTIRLALDMSNEGQLFISAMGIKMVSCIDFKNEEKCSISIPSPRSIIMIPDEHSNSKSIILSSRRCNAIYRLNQDTYEEKILQSLEGSKIDSPRYIAYHEKGGKLCVQVVKNSTEDELAIFDLQISEQPDQNTPMIID